MEVEYESRKREVSEIEDDDGLPEDLQVKKAKKPLDREIEKGTPLTQKEVVYFQKEAIWRQMQFYKRKYRLVVGDLDKYERKYERVMSQIVVLSTWYEQLMTLFRGQNEESSPSPLFVEEILITNEDLDTKLKDKRDQLLQVIGPVLQRQQNFTDGDIIEKLSRLNNELSSVKTQFASLKAKKNSLSEKVELLNSEMDRILKSQDRHSSITLTKVDESMDNPSILSLKSEAPNGVQKNSIDNNDSDKNNFSNGNGSIKIENSNDNELSHAVDKEKYESLLIELKELQAANEKLEEQFKAVTTQSNNQSKELHLLQEKLAHLTPSDLEKYSNYQILKSTNEHLVHKIEELNRMNDLSLHKLSEMELNLQEVKNFLDKELLNENDTLKKLVQKGELDLVRIRTARDELLGKYTVLEQQINAQKGYNELVKLNENLLLRIKALETETVTNDIENDEKLLNETNESLVKRIKILQNELKEIESIFHSVLETANAKLKNASELENLIKKLTIEKNKADQKYFASMRLKDLLLLENKILKVQIGKTQELLTKFNELEKAYVAKIDILTRSVNDYKLIKENSIQEMSKLQEQVKVLTMKKDLLTKELKRLLSKCEMLNDELTISTNKLNERDLRLSKLDSKLKQTDSLLKKYKANNTNSLLQEDEKQLEALRAIAKCSVCAKNWKDTAITVCGHVFCNLCTQERLAARLRRCPSCNKSFSANDLLSIHL